MALTNQTMRDIRRSLNHIEAMDFNALTDTEQTTVARALRKLHHVVGEHMIEVFETPSLNPGVYGNPGASPKQLEFQRYWFENRPYIAAATGANQCLAQGMLVSTPRGPVPIESLRVGDEVYNQDVEPTRVTAVWDNGKRECSLYVCRDGRSLVCTPDHMFLCADKRDGKFAKHAIGNFLRPTLKLGNGGTTVVDSAHSVGALPTYDITVADPRHTFLLVNGLVTSNSGKTECVAGLCFCKWIRDHAKNNDIYWIIARTKETLRDVPQRSLWHFLPRRMFPNGVEYQPRIGFGQIPTLHLTLPGGRGKCELWFKSEEQRLQEFESARLHGLWWTECTWERLFGAIGPRLVRHGGWMLMDYVPTEGWHHERIQIPAETGKEDVYHVRFAMADNAHNLAEGSVERLRVQMTAEEAAVRIDGKDGAAFGAIYPQFKWDYHVIPHFPLHKNMMKFLVRGYDYGFAHNFACLWCCLLPAGFRLPVEAGEHWGNRELERETLIVYRELCRKQLTIPVQARMIIESSGNNRERVGVSTDGSPMYREVYESEQYRLPMVCDPSIWNRDQAVGRGTPLRKATILQYEGLKVKKGKDAGVHEDESSMINRVRLWFERDKVLIMDNCKTTIKEHRSWKHEETKDGEARSNEKPVDRDNDTCDVLKQLIAENLTYHMDIGDVSIEAPDPHGQSEDMLAKIKRWEAYERKKASQEDSGYGAMYG